jgi:hypothetical protein
MIWLARDRLQRLPRPRRPFLVFKRKRSLRSPGCPIPRPTRRAPSVPSAPLRALRVNAFDAPFPARPPRVGSGSV